MEMMRDPGMDLFANMFVMDFADRAKEHQIGWSGNGRPTVTFTAAEFQEEITRAIREWEALNGRAPITVP